MSGLDMLLEPLLLATAWFCQHLLCWAVQLLSLLHSAQVLFNSSHSLATLFFLPLTSHGPFHQPYLGLTFCLLFLLAPGVSPRSLHCAAFPQPFCCCHSCMPPLPKSKSQAFFNYSLTYLQASIPFSPLHWADVPHGS